MIFYHGTNKKGMEETWKQGFLRHKRKSNMFKNITPCTYLSINKEEASMYGEYLLEIEYNPKLHPDMNNYTEGCWQLRVYEPITSWKVINSCDIIKKLENK